jgi:hypothetical protein
MKNIVVFYDPTFPYMGERPDETMLLKLHELFTVTDAAGLSKSLVTADSYVHLHPRTCPFR